MIAYRFTQAELWDRIKAESPTWRRRARQRTKMLIEAGAYLPGHEIWSQIKPVFIALQHNKCAYCERKLEGAKYGRAEHDLEHYRPKGAVKAWPATKDTKQYDFPTGGDFPEGYYLLAYHPENYVAACKPCNEVLKCGFFPILGNRVRGANAPLFLREEQPLIPFPLGSNDLDDPEDLITFNGVIANPNHTEGPKYRRARVAIDLFELNRESLRRERAVVIRGVYLSHKAREIEPGYADAALRQITSPAAAHTSCARCFNSLCQNFPLQAEALAHEASALLDSLS